MESRCLPGGGALHVALGATVWWTCGGVLFVKQFRHETPNRRWQDFYLDSVKQATGCCWALVLSKRREGCTEYLGDVLAETTVGVLIEYILLVALSQVFGRGSENPRAFRAGEYTDEKGEFVPGVYFMQVLLWVTCVTGMKCLTPLVTPPFAVVANFLFWAFSWWPSLSLVVATLLVPSCMYALQVWITDDFIKKEGAPGFFWEFVQNTFPSSAVELMEETLACNLDDSPARAGNQTKEPSAFMRDDEDNVSKDNGAGVRFQCPGDDLENQACGVNDEEASTATASNGEAAPDVPALVAQIPPPPSLPKVPSEGSCGGGLTGKSPVERSPQKLRETLKQKEEELNHLKRQLEIAEEEEKQGQQQQQP